MFITLLFEKPLFFVMAVLAAVIALTLHEFTHAAVGTFLGDPTARQEGRLSLNPFVHVDVWGFAMLLTSGFGWAKPVPFNPYALRTRFGGTLLIPLSGPAMNVFQAILAGVTLRALRSEFSPESFIIEFLTLFLWINILLAFFNLLPIPPLDGGQTILALLPDRYEEWKVHVERMGPFLLILIIIADAWSGINILGGFVQYLATIVTTFSGASL